VDTTGWEPEPEPEPELLISRPSPLHKTVGAVHSALSPATQKAIGEQVSFEHMPPSPAMSPISPGEEHESALSTKPTSIKYRALKDTQVYEQPDPGTPMANCTIYQGDVFKVLSETTRTVAGVGEIRFVEAEHDHIMAKDGSRVGWIQMTTSKGEPLCVTEASVQHLLKSVPLLQELEDSERNKVAKVLEAGNYTEQQTIIEFGATGAGCKYMYFVEHGLAEAIIGPDVVRQYGKNDFFGCASCLPACLPACLPCLVHAMHLQLS
jgi:hypothetical protein